MNDAALNPIAPNRAQTRNALARLPAPQQLQSCSVLVGIPTLSATTPHPLVTPASHSAIANTPWEPNRPIQAPWATHGCAAAAACFNRPYQNCPDEAAQQ